jgi:hypothetical protein
MDITEGQKPIKPGRALKMDVTVKGIQYNKNLHFFAILRGGFAGPR